MSAGRPTDDAPSPVARRVVTVVLAVVLLFGLTGLEAWPATAFRLFSLERHDERTVYRAAVIDADGHRTTVDPSSLGLASRWYPWPLGEFADTSVHSRQALCDGIATAVRRTGRSVVEVEVYRARQRIERTGDHWTITSDDTALGSCEVSP